MNDRALEARADREGAMAAAGQQVYAGPVTGALSNVTAAPAAGPMQARKDGEEGRDYKGTRTAAPAERSAEQIAHGQAAVDALGPELAQDTGWDMDSQMEKRGWWSRNLGKYFKQVEIVKRRFPQLKLSDAEAQDLVLQSMGIMSGDKKEAVQRMTMKRAYELTKSANIANDANNAIAERGVQGMGLSKVNGQYSLQGVAQKLGFAKNASWQSQMNAVRQQGAYFNPFAGKAKAALAPARQVPDPGAFAILPDNGDAGDLNEVRRRRLSMA